MHLYNKVKNFEIGCSKFYKEFKVIVQKKNVLVSFVNIMKNKLHYLR